MSLLAFPLAQLFVNESLLLQCVLYILQNLKITQLYNPGKNLRIPFLLKKTLNPLILSTQKESFSIK